MPMDKLCGKLDLNECGAFISVDILELSQCDADGAVSLYCEDGV